MMWTFPNGPRNMTQCLSWGDHNSYGGRKCIIIPSLTATKKNVQMPQFILHWLSYIILPLLKDDKSWKIQYLKHIEKSIPKGQWMPLEINLD